MRDARAGYEKAMSPVDPFVELASRFSAALGKAFGAEVASVDPMLRRSERADVQANFALGLAKRLGKPPRAIAEAVMRELDAADLVEAIEIGGPGFLNITLRSEWLGTAVDRALADPRIGVPLAEHPDRVVIDYSSPNVAKEMHVGHLRSTVIGDALARTLAFRGHEVIRQNHIGDWGTPFGMLIEHLVELGESTSDPSSIGELAAFYREARRKFDQVPGFADRARARVVSLQSGDAETLRLWRVLVEGSKRYFERIYELLDVTLRPEDVCGESFYDPQLAPLAEELATTGRARIDQGALCMFLDGFTGKDGAPLPLIVRKSDGGFGYAATDLVAIRHRIDRLGATRLLYVVGTPQEQHLSMVFAAARTCGWLRPPVRAEHVAFGSVLGTDKRMFRSRSGETARLVDLLEAAIERADTVVDEKAAELPVEERRAIGRAVGVGAIKYADLSSDRIKDYVFDLDRMVAFEGNTAGYLQYAHARIRSMFRKAGKEHADGAAAPVEPVERALALELLSFGSVVESVEQSLEPHRLCGYLYQVANRFSEFYDKCPVLKAEEPQRSARLALADLTARTLAQGLSLLGITAIERM